MSSTAPPTSPLPWSTLVEHLIPEPDKTNGPTNPQSTLRLFDQPEESVRVTLYRDHHAWCPYCQKIWLYLEEMRIPYKIKKVTMFCYGDKESWYKKVVPSGMLPAVEIDGRIVTESDVILFELEEIFGSIPNQPKLQSDVIYSYRKLERKLFSAWCDWLCRRHIPMTGGENNAESRFKEVAEEVDNKLGNSKTPFFLNSGFSIADIIITPYIERMSASLTYYKGFSIRENYVNIDKWFEAMESRGTYIGTQSDFHTHVHDLPPQMGMCVGNGTPGSREMIVSIDGCRPDSPHFKYETSTLSTQDDKREAITRCYVHKDQLIGVNPSRSKDDFDNALRCALTYLATGTLLKPPSNQSSSLRYLRDRVSVPRDMSLHAARELRIALEKVAELDTVRGEGTKILTGNRRDQNPGPFVEAKKERERMNV